MILNGCSLSSGGICEPYKACSSKSCRSASSCIPLLPSKVLVACARIHRHLISIHHPVPKCRIQLPGSFFCIVTSFKRWIWWFFECYTPGTKTKPIFLCP